ncbi:malate/L-lactate dehydrogenase [Purpureocillium lavendulum]|uniref:Malate/L-lactate dehydrogenase n=1 Tax=Purpureocillium lavendulum TaxID=1247861 RepID=A0AB34G5G9_9HYPO|nr:malate/L-lactate dehydrogenase [Purpureocillium lavendulum]
MFARALSLFCYPPPGRNPSSSSSGGSIVDVPIMKASVAILALALLAEGAVHGPRVESAPSVKGNREGKTFSLAQVPNQNFKGLDVPAAFMKAHLRYGDALPAALSRAVKKDPALMTKFKALSPQVGETGTVQATPAEKFDSEYVVPVGFGTPPQVINVNLDTGSADLWVFSSKTNKQSVNGQTLYRPEDSSTAALQQNYTWSIKYGDESGASGVVYKDRVQVGQTYFDQQAVEAAVDVSQEIAADSFASGILGLSMSRANTVKPKAQLTYMDNIKKDLAMPVFTSNLRSQQPGNYNFGYINQSEYSGQIQYAKIDPQSPYWKVSLTGYQVGNSTGDFKALPWNAIVDTGTSLLLAPEDILKGYWGQVRGAAVDDKGMYVFPCEQTLPDFYFGIGQYRGFVPGAYINYGKVNDSTCFGGIQTSDKIGFAILGDVLLKAQFVVFDLGAMTVGFANKNL